MLFLSVKGLRDGIEALLFIAVCGRWGLFHPGLQASYHGRAEASMLHLVEAADGEAARGAHLVDFGLGVVAIGL